MTENLFQNMAKGFQDMGKAKVFLSMPIPISYETWVFLHEIADGDVE